MYNNRGAISKLWDNKHLMECSQNGANSCNNMENTSERREERRAQAYVCLCHEYSWVTISCVLNKD